MAEINKVAREWRFTAQAVREQMSFAIEEQVRARHPGVGNIYTYNVM